MQSAALRKGNRRVWHRSARCCGWVCLAGSAVWVVVCPGQALRGCSCSLSGAKMVPSARQYADRGTLHGHGVCRCVASAALVRLPIVTDMWLMVQAQAVILQNDAIPLMVRWLDSGPEQEVATAAARALAKAAKGNRAVQQAICDAGAAPDPPLQPQRCPVLQLQGSCPPVCPPQPLVIPTALIHRRSCRVWIFLAAGQRDRTMARCLSHLRHGHGADELLFADGALVWVSGLRLQVASGALRRCSTASQAPSQYGPPQRRSRTSRRRTRPVRCDLGPPATVLCLASTGLRCRGHAPWWPSCAISSFATQ